MTTCQGTLSVVQLDREKKIYWRLAAVELDREKWYWRLADIVTCWYLFTLKENSILKSLLILA